MTYSSLTNKIRLSSQSSSRQGARIDTFLVHHTASTSGRGDGVVNMMVNRTRTVSSNYVLGSDGYLWMVVDEDLRAWTSGSRRDGGKGAAWDRRSITIEICNSSGAPNWGISNASIDKAARLLIDLRKRYGIKYVMGHRDLYTKYKASYPTYCPGPDTVARILQREKELMAPPPPPAPPRIAWKNITPVKMYTWDNVSVFDPLTKKVIGNIPAGSTVDIASSVALNGARYYRTDWSTRQGNDSGILSSDLHSTSEPPPPRIAWQNITPVQMHTWDDVFVVDPLTGTTKGSLEPGTVIDIASSVTIDGVLYYRSDWSTRQGNDSGIVSTDLHLTPKPTPVEPEPTPVEPEPVEPEPTPVKKPVKPASIFALIGAILVAAVVAILSNLGG